MRALARISAAVRTALGKPVLSALARRAHEAAAIGKVEEQRQAEAKLPQPYRLWLIARRKRVYAKRRHGDSSKSPAANRKHGTQRLGRATDRPGLQSYDAWKSALAAERAAKRAVHSVSP